ncbi:hypothetical protein SDC9_89566 [bioreactor metagenome]|uniref:Uncharacterized protein n=1 Tax=bioreactor metagenome TaxID=1076179 RepID=A0A644ZZA6_9ZZZZ
MSGCADVEQAGFERESDGETRHDQRGGLIEHLGELIAGAEPRRDQRLKPLSCCGRIETKEQDKPKEKPETDGGDAGKQTDKPAALKKTFLIHALCASLSVTCRLAPAI